ncbi:Putative ribosomal N-acetyltransferase YdaF [Paraliobacillus sp. PM-2]|uniref:GNAT family N-acetyltransferase n=1 Tax=Paraliobacillus sp. PM-2 TaxID=1462524 RepID=UPI00061C6841|nr:GNAT family protein [Paraliobacillus sp. PM-2]CQR45829.1 Putative ribosomal N-acetyltransferase YdaF [Paraliobacillus sp. PM-2]
MKSKLNGKRIYIRALQKNDAPALLEINKENREIFNCYSPVDKEDTFFTRKSHEEMIEDQQQAWLNDRQYGFGIFTNQTDKLIGTVNLFFVERYTAEKCMIGYGLDYRYKGNGYMTEAVQLAVRFAFKEAGFHRIEAGVMPRNTGSIRVLENCGFMKEGTLRDELKINGRFEDHHIYSRLSTDI